MVYDLDLALERGNGSCVQMRSGLHASDPLWPGVWLALHHDSLLGRSMPNSIAIFELQSPSKEDLDLDFQCISALTLFKRVPIEVTSKAKCRAAES